VSASAQRGQARGGEGSIIDRRAFPRLQGGEQPSRGKRAWRPTSFSAISAVRSSSSSRVGLPSSPRTVSATLRFPRSIARSKVAIGCPCAVNVLRGWSRSETSRLSDYRWGVTRLSRRVYQSACGGEQLVEVRNLT
jgi:hypothetical protein